jgi:hypothetical protein
VACGPHADSVGIKVEHDSNSALFFLLAAEEENDNHVLGKVKKGRCKHRWCMVHVIRTCTYDHI